MGFQQRMMNMMMGRKSPEDMSKMMGEMMPQMMEGMKPEDMTAMMHEVMPNMMDSCFSEMNIGQRREMLKMCREMLDKIENKYMAKQ